MSAQGEALGKRSTIQNAALKGRNMSAQGEALGTKCNFGMQALKGRNIHTKNNLSHRKRSIIKQSCCFQDEYHALLKKYNVDYDERYVWD